MLGVAVSTAHTDAGGSASGSGDDFVLAGYGRQTAGPLQIGAYAGFARDTIDVHHDFGLAGAGSANPVSGASSLLAGTSIAYTVKLAGFQVTPAATVAFTHMLFDGVNLLSPQGFALGTPRQWTDRLRLTLGPALTRSFQTDRGIKIATSLSAGYLHDTNPVTTLGTQLFGYPALAQSAPAGHDGAFVDVGLKPSFTQSLTGFVRWRGEARAQTRSNQISGGLVATF